jgi:hypothetical protein
VSNEPANYAGSGTENLPATVDNATPSPIEGFSPRLLDYWTAEELAKRYAAKDTHSKNKMVRELREFAAELAGPKPTAIERTLAETAALCWLHARMEDVFAHIPKDRTFAQAAHAMRRLDQAHRRYLTVLRTLAQVRKMALPALQVNVGVNQVNTVAQTPRGSHDAAER